MVMTGPLSSFDMTHSPRKHVPGLDVDDLSGFKII